MSALASRQAVAGNEGNAAQLSAALTQAQGNFDLLVVFRLVGQCFGLLASNVREIIHIRATTRVPNTAGHMEGVVNLRGRIVPVFNLQRKLNLSGPIEVLAHSDHLHPGGVTDIKNNADAGRRTVMVVEEDGALCGLLVEEVTDVVKISPESINTAASKVEKPGTGFVLGTVTLEGDRLATLLSLEALLSD